MKTTVDIEVLKARIIDAYDPEYVVDILEISLQELLDRFEDKLLEKVNEWPELGEAV